MILPAWWADIPPSVRVTSSAYEFVIANPDVADGALLRWNVPEFVPHLGADLRRWLADPRSVTTLRVSHSLDVMRSDSR